MNIEQHYRSAAGKRAEEHHQLTVSGLAVEVVRKDIKNLHLGVYPPAGRVRVATPLHINDEAVRLFVISRLPWIKRQQATFVTQERQSQREYVTGESHYYQGQRYLLDVEEQPGPPTIKLRNNTTMDMRVRPGSTREERERVLTNWYRHQLKAQIPPLLSKWETILDVQAADWGVKQMKTCWGTCTIEARRIWLNLELVKKPAYCLEYIIVHELVHLLERHHNDRFTAYMNRYMPLWQHYRQELNQAPLGYEQWDY